MLEYLGYFCAVIIGIILGLMGTGGAILTVPVLVYIMAIEPVTAAAYSLFIVGTTSAVGTIKNMKDKMVEFRTGMLFAIPSLIGVYISRKFIVPSLPEILFTIGNINVEKGAFLMVLFAILMAAASYSMLKSEPVKPEEIRQEKKTWMIILIFLAGILVGMVGAGGGFLFIPLLIIVAKLPVKKAVATSLLIIAINSLIGFTGDFSHTAIDWFFLMCFTALAIAGIFTGIYLGRFINGAKIKKAFGWFVLLMSVVILAKELL